jgi:peptidoglycan hydrolase-like protein with peptidoglycan-binding domain
MTAIDEQIGKERGEESEAADAITGESSGDGTPRSRRPLLWVGIGIAALAVVGAIGWLAATNGGDNEAAEETAANTASIQRTDLVVTETLDGTLGYGEGNPVIARADQEPNVIGSSINGTITWAAPEGSVVSQGEVLFEVDERPVAVMYGDVPAYRTLSTRSDDGPEVAQLESALVALGFDPDGEVVVDEEFTSSTGEAVEAWQESIGAEIDGVIDMGEVVFTEGQIHVAEVLSEIGDQAGQAIIATSKSPTGTITSIVAQGDIVGEGDVIFSVEGQPIVLLVGTVPAYRSMSVGTSGDDVAQLEAALVQLGFGDGLLVDGVFDGDTREAVVAWQQSVGAAPDGVINLGDVVFSASDLRVGAIERGVGDTVQEGTTVLTTSAAETFVLVQLSAADQGLLAVGDKVMVELPDGSETTGTVAEVGSVAQVGQEGGASFFDVTIVLDEPAAAVGLDEAPVEVAVVTDSAEGVLAVPVTALLALAEGGYAVEVVSEDGSTYLVAAEPGLFADGFVEVTGDGLQAGMEVVIP